MILTLILVLKFNLCYYKKNGSFAKVTVVNRSSITMVLEILSIIFYYDDVIVVTEKPLCNI